MTKMTYEYRTKTGCPFLNETSPPYICAQKQRRELIQYDVLLIDRRAGYIVWILLNHQKANIVNRMDQIVKTIISAAALFALIAQVGYGTTQATEMNSRYCVARPGGHSFECTEDPMGSRKIFDKEDGTNTMGTDINMGVTQRIDGSESEKKAVREVLQQMDEYFLNEILAKPEYESVRSDW